MRKRHRIYFWGWRRIHTGGYVPNLYGGRPFFHKTHKGASTAAGAGCIVLVIDPETLPRVLDASITPGANCTDEEFAERQIQAWADIAKYRPTVEAA